MTFEEQEKLREEKGAKYKEGVCELCEGVFDLVENYREAKGSGSWICNTCWDKK